MIDVSKLLLAAPFTKGLRILTAGTYREAGTSTGRDSTNIGGLEKRKRPTAHISKPCRRPRSLDHKSLGMNRRGFILALIDADADDYVLRFSLQSYRVREQLNLIYLTCLVAGEVLARADGRLRTSCTLESKTM